jgi:predicted AAA+ superfamily ATPase
VITRGTRRAVEAGLQERIAVLLSGLPRVGRTTFAQSLAEDAGGLVISLDATDPAHQRQIADAGSFLERAAGRLVVIDNIDERASAPVVRLVRSASPRPPHARFLLMPRQSGLVHKLAPELAGLVRPVELTPIQPDEGFADAEPEVSAEGPLQDEAAPPLAPVQSNSWRQETHWLRGGLPDSLLASDDDASFRWRSDYLAALLDGGFRTWEIVAADRLSDFVSRIVRHQGQIFDEDKCRSELGLDRSSVRRTLDVLVRMGLVRKLPNWSGRGHPVLYIRDSGLFHAMRGIVSLEHLKADELYGHSWECFAAEALISAAGSLVSAGFYRDKDDNEIDLVLDFRPVLDVTYAIEFKVDADSAVQSGFWRACGEVNPSDKFLVHSGSLSSESPGEIEVVSLLTAIEHVRLTGNVRFTVQTDARGRTRISRAQASHESSAQVRINPTPAIAT